MPALTDHDVASLQDLFGSWGHKSVHAQRLMQVFYRQGGAIDLDSVPLARDLRDRILRELPLRQSTVLSRRRSADGTIKLLIGFSRGGAVEAVMMPSYRPDRAAGCVSSQIGCAMGCDFCASTRGGLERNLEAGEIVEQFLLLRAEAAAAGRRLVSLVFMGMGEPMHNLPNVIAAIRRIAHPELGGLGWRHVTVSTVGIVPGMDALAEADLNVHLALSLHAPDDVTRSRIVPANRRYPVADVMAAARRFEQRSRRIPTIEYCLLAGINDTDHHASLLCTLMDGFRAHVNLIPYNPIGPGLSGAAYFRPSPERLRAFVNHLRQAGIVAHLRDTRGGDVNAACGQLRETHRATSPSPGTPGEGQG